MIPVDVSQAAFIYVFLGLGIVLALWLYAGWRERYDSHRLNETEVYRCNICTHIYIKEKDSPISRCPRCKSYN